jgi:hypothetical protein
MDKSTVEIGQKIKIVAGGLTGCEALVLSKELTEHGSGPREHICQLRITMSVHYAYPEGKTVKLWMSKLQPLHSGVDPNYLFKQSKKPERVFRTTFFTFKCGPCGWNAVNDRECPNCGRTRSCHECGSTDSFDKFDGHCRNCGENYVA